MTSPQMNRTTLKPFGESPCSRLGDQHKIYFNIFQNYVNRSCFGAHQILNFQLKVDKRRVNLARERDVSYRSEMTRIRYNIAGIRDANSKFHSICPDCFNSYLIPHFIYYQEAILQTWSFTSFSKVFNSIFTYFSTRISVQFTGKQLLYIINYM